MQTLFLYAAPAANNFLVCLRLPAKTLFYTCTQFFFSIFSLSNLFFSINFPSLPRQSKNNGTSLRTIKHTTGDLSTYLSLFIFCRTNMTKITSKAILCSTQSMQSSWQLSCWFKWILRTIYQHQCMSQTSKLLCWFLSTPPPPLGEWGYPTKFYMGGGGVLCPEVPTPYPFIYCFGGKDSPFRAEPPHMRNYRNYAPGLSPSLGARDVLCAVSGFGLLPKICRPPADTLPAARVKNLLVPRVSQECS